MPGGRQTVLTVVFVSSILPSISIFSSLLLFIQLPITYCVLNSSCSRFFARLLQPRAELGDFSQGTLGQDFHYSCSRGRLYRVGAVPGVPRREMNGCWLHTGYSLLQTRFMAHVLSLRCWMEREGLLGVLW